jgi:hypothetical protein
MTGAPIPAGDIRFYDGYKPGLEAGDYTLTAVQKTDSTDHPLSDQTKATQAFSVAAPRFALDPIEVQSVFPPANSTGQYDQKLPNIVLRERSLPWERELAEDFPAPPIPNAPAYPWVALLVLEADDIIPPTGGAAGAGPNPTLVGSYAVSDFIAPADPAILKTHLGTQREDEANCHAIDISTATFTRLTPRLADLPWLAHVRQVGVEDKVTGIAQSDGWFSVVIANRFPNVAAAQAAGLRFIAHLVSLEGLASYLVDQPSWPAGVTTVRLASLASWTFTSMPDGLDFKALMTNLTAGQPAGGDGLRLRLPGPWNPPPPGQQAAPLPAPGTPAGDVAMALAQGYAPLHYETRVGDQSYAWYHGALVPHPVPPIAAGTAFASAAAATIYDSGSGTFDFSYASCWETGRLMALRDRAYATAQQRARKTLRRMVNMVRGRAGAAGGPAVLPAQALAAEARGISRPFGRWLSTDAAEALPRPGKAATAPAAAPAAAAPAVPAVQSLRALHARPEIFEMAEAHVAAAATQSGPMASVIDWLGRLQLLEGVPFVHLVPDARMLPPESIRFFYVDPNVLAALSDGAQSVGVQSTRDAAQQGLVRGALKRAAVASARARRPALFGRTAALEASAGGPVAGFLLRSAAVSGWPGLEVKAFLDKGGTQPIDSLRLDHIANDVLIGLYAQVPARIDIEEPKEGLAFGVEDEWAVTLRHLSGASVGQQIAGAAATLDASFRRNDVLQVDVWQKHLIGLSQLSGDASIWGPAGFALQMISSPERMIFDNGGTP